MPKKFAGLLVGLALTIGLSACSPAQFKAWLDLNGFNSSQYTEAQLADGAKISEWYWAETINAAVAAAEAAAAQAAAQSAADADLHKYDHVLSDASLARLRQCESGGNYSILSPGGAYRGAYQFARSTWNSVAGRHYPAYVGVDPAAAAPLVQDAMARALYTEMGRSPWPVCGRYL